MRHLRNAGLAALVLAASASASMAQKKGSWEVGADVVGLSSSKTDGVTDATTSIGLNAGSAIRVGKMVTDKIAVEPNLSWSHSSSGSGNSGNSTELSVAALWFFKTMEEAKPGFYVRPFVGMSMDKFESGGSTVFDETRTHFGVGAGMERKSMGVIWRVEAFFQSTPKKDTSPSVTDMGLKLGGGFNP